MPISGTVTVSATQFGAAIQVPIMYDGLPEPSESYRVVLSNPTNGFVIMSGTVQSSILDSSPPPAQSFVTLSAAQSTVNEGETAVLVFSRSNTTNELTVYYSFDGHSTANLDDFEEPAMWSVVFAAGQSTASVLLPVSDDALAEPVESMSFTIVGYTAGPYPYTIGDPASATISIAQSDQPVNQPPVGTDFETIYHAAANYGSRNIPLWNYFSDPDHADEQLTFSVTSTSGPSIYYYVTQETGDLALSFLGNNIPGITEFTAL